MVGHLLNTNQYSKSICTQFFF